jgi:hypothetical protein
VIRPADPGEVRASKRRIMATVRKLCAEGICMTGSYHPDEMDEAREEFTIAAIVVRRALERMSAGDLAIEWSRAVRSRRKGVGG